jgi:DNA polymerase-3 subunit alpha
MSEDLKKTTVDNGKESQTKDAPQKSSTSRKNKNTADDFVHLHVHSHFSLLNALPKIPDLVARAKEEGMTALGLTDAGNLYGAIEFYQKCLKEDIKPIIGVDFYVSNRTRHDKESRIDNSRTRLVLLAKNRNGYGQLIELVTASYLEGFYYKPRIDKELIEKFSADLICIAPAFSGEISEALRVNDEKKALELVEYYRGIYGAENFYMELTHHPEIEDFRVLTEKIQKFADTNEIPLVATGDVYYMNPEDKEARRTLVSVSSSFGGGGSNFDRNDADFSFIGKKRVAELFKDNPEAIANTKKIADACNIEIELENWKFPDYKIESGRTPDEELRHMAYNGIEWRGYDKNDPKIIERIDYELDVIATKGYSKYFLAVADILKAAADRKILSNTRGSAAGSLVSYLIGITIVDPIALNLPFERFLNPGRPSAPDVDMDFADAQRDELIDYVREKYGHDHVAQIGTFGTMAAKGAVRDVTRAMGYEYAIGDQIAKLIPMGAQGFPMTIDRALDEVSELKDLYKKDKDVAAILDMAKKIEGCARHIGVHAAGVVISPDKLTLDVPIQYDPKGSGHLITQYNMHAVGEDGVGLLKFDFLGLKNLTIMGNTFKLVEKLYDKELKIDKIPIDDQKTYDMLARGETIATFQLNGQGMTQFLKQLKPTNIDDINAMVALYRPGPMAFIPDYIERKQNPSKVKYIDNRFEEILAPTFGILIYQDDIMLLAVNFAGYSWGEADKFRKAMGKKIPEIMREQKEKFSKGCAEVGGLDEKQIKDLWESIETFAAYGFNKAHAASYGRIAYLTSYLKANYPVLYMTAVLTAESGDTDKIAEMVAECNRMGIDVLAPNINESFADFTVIDRDPKTIPQKPDNSDSPENKIAAKKFDDFEKYHEEVKARNIRFGLTTIKNFGEGITNAIIEERKRGGKFSSLEDFINRVRDRNLNKKSMEALIKCGALDEFGERGQMLANLEDILAYSKELAKESADQNSLFAGADIAESHLTLKPAEPASNSQKLTWEKELLGLYVSGHPLESFKDKLAKGAKLSDIKTNGRNNITIITVGHVDEIRPILTKKGDNMAFMKISDLTDSLEVVVFPKLYEKHSEILESGKCIVIKGKISNRNGEISLIADGIKELEE